MTAIDVEEQEFSSFLGELRPFDIPVVVKNAPSRIKGDLVRHNDKALTGDDDEGGKDRRARPVDDENSVVNDGKVRSVQSRVPVVQVHIINFNVLVFKLYISFYIIPVLLLFIEFMFLFFFWYYIDKIMPWSMLKYC